MKLSIALLLPFITAALADVTPINGCTVAHKSDGNTFSQSWTGIPADKMSDICQRYEEAVHRHAGQAGNKQTRVVGYFCQVLNQNSFKASVMMNKQSCVIQVNVLVPALHNAINYATNVAMHQCWSSVNTGKC